MIVSIFIIYRTGEASNFKVEHAHGHEVKAKIMVLAEEIDVLR